MIAIPDRVALRAATRFEIGEHGCLISTYSRGSHGYAQVGWVADGKVRVTTAHRAAWQHFHGPITGELHVDHLCFNLPCVNPVHLRLLPNEINCHQHRPVDFDPAAMAGAA